MIKHADPTPGQTTNIESIKRANSSDYCWHIHEEGVRGVRRVVEHGYKWQCQLFDNDSVLILAVYALI
jgi:hypothetical protein